MTLRRAAAVVTIALLAASVGAPAAAEDAPAPPLPAGSAKESPAAPSAAAALAAEKAARRAAVADSLGPGAVLLVLSPAAVEGAPATGRNSDFEYLSPIAVREGAIVCIAGAAPAAGAPGADAVPRVDRLYLPVRNPAMERWTGAEPGPGPETAAGGALGDARATDQLADDLAALLRTRTSLHVSAGPAVTGGAWLAKLLASVREKLPGRWVRIVDAPGGGRDDLAESLRRALPARGADGDPADTLAKLPVVEVRSARPAIGRLRETKSASEIERIRRAVAASVAGHDDVLRVARPGMSELQLEAVFEMRCRYLGCRRQAYPSIVGSGPNSCVLHYDRSARTLEDGDLVVVDAGGEFEGYASDVTRTFPANGTFTPEQAKVYDAVLEAQEAAISAVRPGMTLRKVHDVAYGVLERHGLAKWFLHATCHSVGLDVHDAWRADAVLREGCVITVEPGVYDAARRIGVRIEDTVLVTANGCEVLSAALPKRRADVEERMRAELDASSLPR